MKKPFLSFCITCKGRLHHLARTLPENLEAANRVEGVEFVVLDYASPDGLRQWMQDRMPTQVGAGRLQYFQLIDASAFNVSHAKNVAHLLATGDLLCNLDADNFIGSAFLEATLDLFHRFNDVVTHGRRCAWGRIAIRRAHFMQIGGYEESLEGWGGEDQDLLHRAKNVLGLRPIRMSQFDRYISHGNEERTRYFRCKDLVVSRKRNRARLRECRRAGVAYANMGRRWGEGIVYHNFEPKPIRVSAGSPLSDLRDDAQVR